MTDHYAAAKLHLADAFEETAPEWFTARAITAQVHAVLALAEQTRIANLIALSDADTDLGHIALEKRPDIARALRIETP